jgi:hypothetical protein
MFSLSTLLSSCSSVGGWNGVPLWESAVKSDTKVEAGDVGSGDGRYDPAPDALSLARFDDCDDSAKWRFVFGSFGCSSTLCVG